MKIITSVFLLLAVSPLWAQGPTASRCHVFIDYDFIWTLEMVQDAQQRPTPILNIITFTQGQWEFRPPQIHIRNSRGQEARVEQFSLDTGVAGEPYRTPYLKVLGNSFIGLDLEGNFGAFEEPTQVEIDLGKDTFQLQAVDCLDFEMLAEKINKVNFDSPDVGEDYQVLGIQPMGRRVPNRNAP